MVCKKKEERSEELVRGRVAERLHIGSGGVAASFVSVFLKSFHHIWFLKPGLTPAPTKRESRMFLSAHVYRKPCNNDGY